jgi:hypothetical protein
MDLAKLLIHFNYYSGDYELAQRLVSNIYSIYPKANVLGISDGPLGDLSCPTHITINELKNHNIQLFINRNNQILYEYGNRYGIEWYLQLDPDSYIIKPIKWPDLRYNWYGQVIKSKGLKFVYGCAELLHKSIIDQLQTCKVEPMSYERGLSRDMSAATYLNPMGIFPKPWAAVKASLWRISEPLSGCQIIHPVPLNPSPRLKKLLSLP